MPNEGFREIQLNGKQLVFLFMAATVVLVVTFLCGVMVGRGVDSRLAAAAAAAPDEGPVDPTAAVLAPAVSAVTPGSRLPVAANETLTYPDRLEDPTPPAETLALPMETAAASADEPAVEPASSSADDPVPVEPPLGEPAGSGFVVQVAAVRERGEAETIATRLSAKGYPAFVTTPGNGAATVFRVRIGKYDDRRDAESIAGRLEKEEQFKPWITR